MDLSTTIKSLKTGEYTITRRTPVANIKGRAQPPTTDTFSIEANVQPATGKVRHLLPEGDRQKESIAIYTQTELFGSDTELPDQINVKGITYEMSVVTPWDTNGNYFLAVAVKL